MTINREGSGHRYLFEIAIGLSMAFSSTGIAAPTAELVTMEVEAEALDLDNGSLLTLPSGDVFGPVGADIKLALNTDRSPGAVVFPAGEGVEMAFVAGAGFDGVSSADVANLTFSAYPTDLPFTANDCVVIRTDQGGVYKVGNASGSDLLVTFNYAAL